MLIMKNWSKQSCELTEQTCAKLVLLGWRAPAWCSTENSGKERWYPMDEDGCISYNGAHDADGNLKYFSSAEEAALESIRFFTGEPDASL